MERIIIEFISTFKNYDNEITVKPYTIRDFKTMPEWKKKKVKKATHIRIRRGYTSTFLFKKISHKFYWKNDIILSYYLDMTLDLNH